MDFPVRFKIAGMHVGKRMANAKYTNHGTRFIIEREPENEYDGNAIKVYVPVKKGKHRLGLGYVPAKIAKDLAPLMDAGKKFETRFSYKIVSDNGVTKGLIIKVDQKEATNDRGTENIFDTA